MQMPNSPEKENNSNVYVECFPGQEYSVCQFLAQKMKGRRYVPLLKYGRLKIGPFLWNTVYMSALGWHSSVSLCVWLRV